MTPSFLQHDPEWEAAVGCDWWRHIFAAQLSDRLHTKQGRSIARWTIRCGVGSKSYFVKRHYRHTWWRTLLKRCFGWGVSHAQREWHHLEQARRCGVPTPRATAVAELTQAGGLRSVLIVEELENWVALHEAIPETSRSMEAESFRTWKSGLFKEMARMVRLLHDQGLFHRDLYFCHFFIERRFIRECPDDWKGRVVLIDFHRLTRRRLLRFPLQVKDLAQWQYSSAVEGVTAQDRRVFWLAYLQGRRRSWLRALVDLKTWFYQQRVRGARS